MLTHSHRRFVLAVLFLLSCAQIHAAQADPIAAIVEPYRQVIVLMDGAQTLDATTREHAQLIGKVLFHQQLDARDELTRQLLDELRAAPVSPRGERATPQLDAVLDRIETDPDLHDADKLALRDLLEDLRVDVSKLQPPAPQLVKRIRDDLAALAQIQALYEKEIARIQANLDMRALPVRREAWQRYLDFLNTRYRRADLLARYQGELAGDSTEAPPDSGMRGDVADPAAVTVATETFGRQLPDKTLLLTFDDGPHGRYTDQILDILGRYGLGAVFFQIGQNVGTVADDGTIKLDKRAEVSRRIIAAGSVLANHSYTHANLPKLGDADLSREIDTTETLLRDLSGDTPPLFRPPYGARNKKVLTSLGARQLQSVQWNIDSLDWADPIATSVADRVIKEVGVQGRGIILFHDIHDRAVAALPTVIDTLQAEGYQFARWDGSGFSVGTAAAAAGDQAAEPKSPYRQSWAVLIGIDDYQQWPKLRYAVNDAKGVQALLKDRYGFADDHVFTLFDGQATRQNILTLLGDTLGDPEKVQREDRVFVFYAGHGATRRLASGRDLGYIIPVDADLTHYQGSAISMTSFQDIAEGIAAKHLLFVMDSCYSGLGLTRGGAVAGQNYLQEISRRSARQMFTAGGADQQVADTGPNGHSVFTWALLRALGGEGDLNGDGVITASELAAWSAPMVSSMSQQTPAFGNLPGSEGGEFVFELGSGDRGLNALSAQLDHAAGELDAELKQLREEIARKSQRNSTLAQQLAQAHRSLKQLDSGAPGANRSAASTETAIQHNEQGMAYYQSQDYAGALSEFLTAAALDPAYALAANNVGFVYSKLGQWQEAVRWYERTIRIDPQRAVAWLNAGDAYLQLQQPESARRAYEQYLTLKPASETADYARQKLSMLDAQSP